MSMGNIEEIYLKCDCLNRDHGIYNAQDLVMKKQSLEQKELVGVSKRTHYKLQVVAMYIESKGVNTQTDPPVNFTRKEYYETLEKMCKDMYEGDT